MEHENNSQPLAFFDIDPEEILEEARRKGLKVSSVQDFREIEDYTAIENMMDQYIASYARYSAIGGSTSGIGGFVTSMTLGGLEVMSTAIQLYRLSQRFALLNGFDPANPLHQEKARNIYFNALGFKAATEAAVKLTLLVTSIYKDKEISDKLVSVLERLSRKTQISQKITHFIPIVGGAVGAYTSYSYAYDTGNSMRDAFKEYYHSEWQ